MPNNSESRKASRLLTVSLSCSRLSARNFESFQTSAKNYTVVLLVTGATKITCTKYKQRHESQCIIISVQEQALTPSFKTPFQHTSVPNKRTQLPYCCTCSLSKTQQRTLTHTQISFLKLSNIKIPYFFMQIIMSFFHNIATEFTMYIKCPSNLLAVVVCFHKYVQNYTYDLLKRRANAFNFYIDNKISKKG